MSRQRRDDRPRDPEAKAILAPLVEITRIAYERPEGVWDHFLALSEAFFVGIARATGDGTMPAELSDLPEVREAQAAIQPRYGAAWEQVAPLFGRAFIALCEASESYMDVLGHLYMTWVLGEAQRGQFFTHFSVAQLNAQLCPVMPMVWQRIHDAETQHPDLVGMALAAATTGGDEGRRLFVERVAPLLRAYVEPVSISDVACGSGAFLLAAAELLPWWVLALELVQFHGIDIDARCVRMTRVNLLRYGISPRFIRHGNTLTLEFFDEPEPPSLPPTEDEPAPKEATEASIKELPQAV